MNSRTFLLSSFALLALACSDDPPTNPTGGAGGTGGTGGAGGSSGSTMVDAGSGSDAQSKDVSGGADAGSQNDSGSRDDSAPRDDGASSDRGTTADTNSGRDTTLADTTSSDVVSNDVRLDSTSPPTDAPAADVPLGDGGDPTVPRFPQTGKYTISIPVGDASAPDPADVYYPNPPDLHTASYSFPIVILFQGAKVARNFYSSVMATVASYGFVVVAPDHVSNNLGGPGLYAELSEIAYDLSQMKLENANASAPVHGVVDTAHVALIGHSYGAASGISGMANSCFPPIPFCTFTRPPELVGGAFYGGSTSPIGAVDVGGLPILMIQGDKDGKNTPSAGQQTFDALSKRPKAFVTLLGANHYGVTDVDNPAGADAEVNAQTLDHATGVASVGRWMGVFFAAYLAKDQAALGALRNAAKLDANITMNLQE